MFLLPLTFSSYALAGYQVCTQTLRRWRYRRLLQDLLATSTIVVDHRKRLEDSRESRENSKCLIFDDDHLQIYSLKPMKDVNLSTWMSYAGTFVKDNPDCCESQDIFVMIETQFIVDQAIRNMHPGYRIHALSLGKPVAWRSTDGFDVILSCGLDGFIQLVDAYGQRRLHLDEDLQIKRFSTITLSGWPQSMCSESKNENLQNHDHEPKREQNTARDEYLKEKERRPVKPPNVLVYCGANDEEGAKATYTAVKSSLELCLNTDVYIIYHLTHAEMLASPWVENTALLLIASDAHITTNAESKIKDFVSNNRGTLLSFNSTVESTYATKVPTQGNQVDGNSRREMFTFKLNDTETISCLRGGFSYDATSEGSEVIVASGEGDASSSHQGALVLKKSVEGGGTVVMSQLFLERDTSSSMKDPAMFTALKQANSGRLVCLKHVLASLGMDVSPRATPALTPCLLLSQQKDMRKKFLNAVHRKLNNESVLASKLLNLAFLENFEPASTHDITSTHLPVITGTVIKQDGSWTTGFDEQDYWRHLQTSRLGQIVLYTDVIASTMPVFEGMLFSLPFGSVGPVAVAGRQTSGRGRGGNMWLSPLGCAMFTFPLSFDLYSVMGQKISFLQHLISTAVVHGIRTMPGYEDLDLRLKWPNDIYYGKGMKLGGVIVTSTLMGSTLYATIGCGVNVANSNPTICINDIIQLYNRSAYKPSSPQAGAERRPLQMLTPAGVIARTLTTLEKLISDFEKHGHERFCETYYKYWLHGGVKVTLDLETSAGNGQGEICGLDEFGFLSVRKSSGETISVQPDGNSFDMMQNLVYCKRRL